MRTRAYTRRQHAEREAAEAAAAEAAMAATHTIGTSPASSSPMARDTRRLPIRNMRSLGFFHITRENGQDHFILLDNSRVSVVVQSRPRQPSSKGSTSSSCTATSNKPALSTPALGLETNFVSDLEVSDEIRHRLVRQQRLVRAHEFWIGFLLLKLLSLKAAYYPTTTHPSEGPGEDAPSSQRTRLIMDCVEVPPHSNLKHRNTCSLVSCNVGQPPIIANSATCRRTFPSETTTPPEQHESLVDEILAHSQAGARRTTHDCLSIGFLVFFCLMVLVLFARPVGFT